jgi:hypothetical protein
MTRYLQTLFIELNYGEVITEWCGWEWQNHPGPEQQPSSRLCLEIKMSYRIQVAYKLGTTFGLCRVRSTIYKRK